MFCEVKVLERLKSVKKLILVLIDIALINFSYIAALYFRFSYNIPSGYLSSYKNGILLITLAYLLIFYFFRLYKSLWTYASTDEFLLAIGGCITGSIASFTLMRIFNMIIPTEVNILASILTVILICGFRISFRIYRRIILTFDKVTRHDFKKVMVIGAGSAGSLIIKEMNNHPEMKYKPVVMIDDSKFKAGTTLAGVEVIGGREKIEQVAEDYDIDIILLAIPSLNNEDKKEIIDICKRTGCELKLIPGVYELLDQKFLLNKIRDVDVEDLLGREAIKLDMNGIEEYIKDRTILVTGGGGSIGSELCRQLVRFKPKRLMILDIYENNAYDLQNELKYKYPDLDLKVIIASIRDKKRLDNIFNEYKPEVVFHAAAHKHVPLMEDNPSEAIKNNVFGTLNLSQCADKHEVKRFVMISTDKAVNPTNVMGATKRVCEMIVQSMDKISKTQFVAVRFGNVLGSNGSVIPLFKKQIAQGGPVTVTHKDITRFFMTIPEAAQLVLQAGAFANGGEIFVLDMGEPVRIYDLACDLIRLSGFEPNDDIKVLVTGLRPGEKLYEEVLMDEEGLGKTGHDKIFVGRPMFDDLEVLREKIEKLSFIVQGYDKNEIIRMLKELVPTFVRNSEEVAVVEEN